MWNCVMLLVKSLLLVAAGFTVLIMGAEYLVRGASRLAARFHIPHLVIGLTVVAFGTSTPEIAVAIKSGLAGRADIAIGTIIGSTVFNILFILGLSAAIHPLLVSKQLIKMDAPLMIAAAVVLYLLSLDGVLGRWDGALLFTGIIAYILLLLVQNTRRRQVLPEEPGPGGNEHQSASAQHWAVCLAFIVLGLVLTYFGADWCVKGAVSLAALLGVSDLLIGILLIAAGTSLPELATSVVASLHDEGDISVGNIVGSNIFNILAVLGLAALLTPGGVAVSAAALHFDLPVMVVACAVCLPIFYTRSVISRWEGLLLLAYYFVYTAYLILEALHSPVLGPFAWTITYLAFPATAVLLLVTTWRAVCALEK